MTPGSLRLRAIAAWSAAVALLMMAAARGAPQETPRPARPDIVVILADDMGFSDLGCYGSEIATPHLDALASRGVRFTQLYNGARCCPTRASLLTGLYPHQAGVGHMVSGRGAPGYQGFLNDRCVTLGELLRPAGYRTFLSGKWHVGESRPHWPVDRGFERSFSLISGATNYFRLDPGRRMAQDGEPWSPPAEGFYITDAITDAAVAAIDDASRARQPFFLYVGYTAPHWPLHALEADIARYRGSYRLGWDELRRRRHARQIELGIVDARWPLSPRDPQAPAWESLDEARRDDFDLRMAVYAAQIDRMDRGVGRIVERLRAAGRLESTLIVFLADNGGCAEAVSTGKAGAPPGTPDSFLAYGLPWANASNTPFRSFKHWTHEGGIATPCIVHWPAGIRGGGRITHEVGHIIDVLPTCAEVAGASYPAALHGKEILPPEGVSLLPALRGGVLERAAPLFWEHEGNRAVRLGRWKLVARHGEPWELYDCDWDRTETDDLARKYPDKVGQLAAAWGRWAARAGVVPWDELLTRERARPNILLAIADDWSWPHAGAGGDRGVRTPAFDRVAREGVLFRSAFCAAPSCTPSRAALLTGQAPHRLDESGNLWSTLRREHSVYPDLLEAKGYVVGHAGKGWGPGRDDAGGRTRNPAGPRFASFAAFLDTVPASSPFCFWYGSQNPHREYEKGSGLRAEKKLEDAAVPPWLPDTPEVRSDLLDYQLEVERFDAEVAELLRVLETSGRADSTLLVVTSDNGMPFPRAKANLHDGGTRVPLAVRWPARLGGRLAGRVVDDLVLLTDLAPTFLRAAGLPVPREMTGRPLQPILLDREGREPRDAVFLERERHANVRRGDLSYPCRAIRTRELLYIRNLRPGRWPAGDPEVWKAVGPFGDVDGSPSKDLILERRGDPAVAPSFQAAFAKRPFEELYDLARDPGQTANVAAEPAYAARLAELRERLEGWQRETADPRVAEQPADRGEAGGDGSRAPWDDYPYFGGPPR